MGLSACGPAANDGIEDPLADLTAAGAKMSNEELIAKAKEETGKFIAYGNTSRITDAMKNFVAKYGEQIGLDTNSASAAKKSDSDIYTLLENEASLANKNEAASMVLVQDSATLDLYRKNSDYLSNYHSDLFSANVDADALVPLAHQYINKLFIWNSVGEAPKFSNVWDLLDTQYEGKIFFKSPTSEAVNKNFLMTLTSPKWVSKMDAAYKAKYGKDFVPTEELKNSSYAWIKGFLKNANTSAYGGDTDIAEGLSQETNSGRMGLFVLSKLRSSSVNSDNLQVGCWEQEITPFAGFMYAIYAQLVSHGPRPYTAMLFTNYLMTEEGFKPWGKSVGGYSANNTVPVYSDEHVTDKSLDWYKQRLVLEDGEYINTVKATLSPWIDSLLAK